MARRPAALLLAVALLGGCAAAGREAPPAGPVPAPADAPPSAAPATPAPGDRYFVAVRREAGKEPVAERFRWRPLASGTLREEVTWGRSFTSLEPAAGKALQVFSVAVDGRGLVVGLLDAENRAVGESAVEVPAPYRPGTTWEVDAGRGARIRGSIDRREDVETPGGTIAGALRVSHRTVGGDGAAMVTWYDGGMRPVRSEIRDAEGRLVEARAALAPGDPTPETGAAAFAWARKNLR